MDRKRLLVLIAAALLMLVAACTQSPSITLTLDTADTELMRGGEVQVEVALTRTGGATADVELSVTGLPINVSASFSPATLSGTTSTSTLTLSSTAAATEGSYALSVSGVGTGLASSALLRLDVASLEVKGRAVLPLNGGPMEGVAVRSQSKTTVTDADGAFILSGLSIPYDLAVWYTPGGWVHVYEGLTAANLDLAPLAGSPIGAARSSVISGSLSGGSVPGLVNQPVSVCAEGFDGIALGCVETGEGDTSYSLGVQWYGDTSRQVRVHALQTERAISGTATAFLGYGTSPTTVLQDTVSATVNLDLGTAPPSTTVAAKFDTSLAGIVGSIGAVQLGPNLTMPIAIANSSASNQDILMPVIAGATYTYLGVNSLQQFGWQAGLTGATASVSVPGTPTLLAPAFGASSVTTGTEFTVDNPTGGPLTFEWERLGSALSIAVTTMATTTTLPDLAPYGLALPGLTTFRWRVYAQSGSSTEDGSRALRDYRSFTQLLLSGGSTGFSGAGSFARSDAREFTTGSP